MPITRKTSGILSLLSVDFARMSKETQPYRQQEIFPTAVHRLILNDFIDNETILLHTQNCFADSLYYESSKDCLLSAYPVVSIIKCDVII